MKIWKIKTWPINIGDFKRFIFGKSINTVVNDLAWVIPMWKSKCPTGVLPRIVPTKRSWKTYLLFYQTWRVCFNFRPDWYLLPISGNTWPKRRRKNHWNWRKPISRERISPLSRILTFGSVKSNLCLRPRIPEKIWLRCRTWLRNITWLRQTFKPTTIVLKVVNFRLQSA